MQYSPRWIIFKKNVSKNSSYLGCHKFPTEDSLYSDFCKKEKYLFKFMPLNVHPDE